MTRMGMMDMEEEEAADQEEVEEVDQEEEDHQDAMELAEVEALAAEAVEMVAQVMMMMRVRTDHLMTATVSGQPSKEDERHLHNAAHMHQECATVEEDTEPDRAEAVATEAAAVPMMAVTHQPQEILTVHQDRDTLEYQPNPS